MPECRGVEVHVVNRNMQNIAEWGVQRLDLKEKGLRVSAYIQSSTDEKYQISVQLRISWYNEENLLPDDEDWIGDEGGRQTLDARFLGGNISFFPDLKVLKLTLVL